MMRTFLFRCSCTDILIWHSNTTDWCGLWSNVYCLGRAKRRYDDYDANCWCCSAYECARLSSPCGSWSSVSSLSSASPPRRRRRKHRSKLHCCVHVQNLGAPICSCCRNCGAWNIDKKSDVLTESISINCSKEETYSRSNRHEIIESNLWLKFAEAGGLFGCANEEMTWRSEGRRKQEIKSGGIEWETENVPSYLTCGMIMLDFMVNSVEQLMCISLICCNFSVFSSQIFSLV